MNIFDTIKFKDYKNIGMTGLTDGFFAFFISNLAKSSKKNILIVANSLYEANKIYSLSSSFNNNTYLFPMDDFLSSEAMAISPDLLNTRMETLKCINNSSNNIVVTNLMGYLRYLPNPKTYNDFILKLDTNTTIKPNELYNKLYKMGYKPSTLVTNTGEVGLRGFVIDVYPIDFDNPIRIEFFGDDIDEIKYFDPETQKSSSSLDNATIYPNFEFLTNEDVSGDSFGKQKYLYKYEDVKNIYSYLDDPIVIYKDYSQIVNSFKEIEKEKNDYNISNDKDYDGNYMFSLDDVFHDAIFYLDIDNIKPKYVSKLIDFKSKSVDKFYEKEDAIKGFLNKEVNDKKTTVICLKDYQINNFKKKFNYNFYETDFSNIHPNSLNIVVSDFSSCFYYNDITFVSSNTLFINNTVTHKYKSKFRYSSKISDINKLEIGDYVVHSVYGIGIYNGIKTLNVGGSSKDFIEVLYAGTDKLYVPAQKIDNLYKYSGKEGFKPTINKLNSDDFKKTKRRVSQKVRDMADSLLKLYAEREKKKGFAFSPDTDLQLEFEKAFPYELTKDQKLAIKQVKEDMESDKPMDRLLCGDVGFGKTEVAFVAAFKAVSDSKQVFLLCPTTILSNQHYKNALERFNSFPVNIKLLNRFTSPKETKEIYEGIQNGTVDFVIGTHKLLNKNIKPKDLGLLIIDEEQRFGVKQKEEIKSYKSNVDVLTLSATPIPRTLQMSMTGIRSLSLIETAPSERYPVQTYVIAENDEIIKDALMKELARSGQAFVLFNNTEKIADEANLIKNLVPNARVVYAHGKMNKDTLENRMLDFIDYKYDILVCTTIIETGIDIPNVNTLIILDADRFGLSQLYQIRGRVGRSNKFGYAYLMYNPHKELNSVAIKRLNVIKEFTELGSGFSIATRDLSIRGAGDILGAEQAGFINSVGIDMYLAMLNEEVNRRHGIITESHDDIKPPLLNTNTHIDDSYVKDPDLKIEIHRLINEVDSKESFDKILSELTDRFGKPSSNIIDYMYEEWFENISKPYIERVRETNNFIEITFKEHSLDNVSMDELFTQSFNICPMFRFKKTDRNIVIILDTVKLEDNHFVLLIKLMDLIKKLS